MSSFDIFALRKQGRSAEALKMARAELAQRASDIWFLRAYAWALYDHAKDLVDRYETKRLPRAAFANQFSLYMREFAQMAEPLRGDNAFSQILRLAGKVSRDWPEFLAFSRWAGVADFSEDDKKPFVNEQGKTLDSLRTRFVRAICRQTALNAAEPQAGQEEVEWGKGILEEALRADPNDQWLNYYQSKVHLACGDPDQAIKRLVPVLRRQSRAAWPWALLGEILEASQPEDALTCYTHATHLAREEQEVATVRIQLAQRLALAGRFAEAAQQANLALRFREENSFKVPQQLQQLTASDWYQKAVRDDALRPLPKVDAAARAVLEAVAQRNLTYTPGVIDHINTEKELSYVATGTEAGVGLLHRRFPEVAKLPPGTFVEIGRADPDGPALGWRPSEVQALPGLCESFAGTMERQEGKAFAFIRSARADVYVPPELAEGFTGAQSHEVTCLAIRRKNKQGKVGWRAVAVSPP